MPSQLTFGTAGATGGGFSAYKGLQPGFDESRLDVRPSYSWQRRSAKTWKDRNQFFSLWSRGLFGACGIDNSAAYTPLGLDLSGQMGYEPFSCDGDGCQRVLFIRGVTQDSGGSPLANATVQGFVTATDTYKGEVVSDTDGTFTLGTETVPGTLHYVVAYKVGGGDVAGTSVNTLLPTNVDGSVAT